MLTYNTQPIYELDYNYSDNSDSDNNITQISYIPGDTLKTLHFFLKLFRGTRKCLRYMTF